MKIMRVKHRGYLWEVPVEAIARNRAGYYSAREPEGNRDAVYKEELDYAMGSTEEAMDWFLNNMDWEDVEKEAVLVEIPPLLTRPPQNDEGNEYRIVEAEPRPAAPVPVAVPAGHVVAAIEPTEGLLLSMAMRYDHSFFMEKHEIFEGTGVTVGHTPEERTAILVTMRQLHEEVVGTGFHSPERENWYVGQNRKSTGARGGRE